MERPSPIEPDGPFDGLRWSCIGLGAVLDNVLSFLAGIPMMLYFAGAEAFSEDPETADRAIDRVLLQPEFLLVSLVVGIAITTYAAFWAARRAGLLHVRHGGWTAVASAVLAFLLLLLPGATAGPAPPWWYEALGLAAMLPAGVLGGWLASRVGAPPPGA